MTFSLTTKLKGLDVTVKFPWKVGIVTFMAFPNATDAKSVKEALKTIADDGFFDEVEIPIYPDEIWNEIKDLLKEKEIIVGGALQPDILTNKLSIHTENEEERRKAIEYVKSKIDLAAKRGINVVALCSGSDPGLEKRDKERKLLIEALKEICSYAKERNVQILLEPFDRDYDRKLLIGPLIEAVDVVKEVRKEYSNVGVLWDLSHAPMLEEKPEDLKQYKEFIAHIHVGCAKREGDTFKDTHPTFYTPGAVNDVSDVARLFKVLYEIGYKGIVTLEIKPEPQQTSLEIINNAKGVFLRAFEIMVKGILT